MDFCTFLGQMWQAVGLGAAAGVVVAVIIEYVPAYQGIDSKWKRLAYLGILTAIALIAYGIAPVGGCVRPDLWTVVTAISGAFTGGTLGHDAHKALIALFKRG